MITKDYYLKWLSDWFAKNVATSTGGIDQIFLQKDG